MLFFLTERKKKKEKKNQCLSLLAFASSSLDPIAPFPPRERFPPLANVFRCPPSAEQVVARRLVRGDDRSWLCSELEERADERLFFCHHRPSKTRASYERAKKRKKNDANTHRTARKKKKKQMTPTKSAGFLCYLCFIPLAAWGSGLSLSCATVQRKRVSKWGTDLRERGSG